jgi:hypothetical protein
LSISSERLSEQINESPSYSRTSYLETPVGKSPKYMSLSVLPLKDGMVREVCEITAIEPNEIFNNFGKKFTLFFPNLFPVFVNNNDWLGTEQKNLLQICSFK